jgi:hypothetical protein
VGAVTHASVRLVRVQRDARRTAATLSVEVSNILNTLHVLGWAATKHLVCRRIIMSWSCPTLGASVRLLVVGLGCSSSVTFLLLQHPSYYVC